MRSKFIPYITMLLAALVVSIGARINHVEIELFMWMLVLTLVGFYAIGLLFSVIVRHFENEAEKREEAEREAARKAAEEEAAAAEAVSDEGEVIEKDVETGAYYE